MSTDNNTKSFSPGDRGTSTIAGYYMGDPWQNNRTQPSAIRLWPDLYYWAWYRQTDCVTGTAHRKIENRPRECRL